MREMLITIREAHRLPTAEEAREIRLFFAPAGADYERVLLRILDEGGSSFALYTLLRSEFLARNP